MALFSTNWGHNIRTFLHSLGTLVVDGLSTFNNDISITGKENTDNGVLQINGGTGKEAIIEFLINNVSKGFLKTNSLGQTHFMGNFYIDNNLIFYINTLDTAADAVITLPTTGAIILLEGNTHAITSITASTAGKIVHLYTHALINTLTMTDGGNLLLAGNFPMTGDSVLTLFCDGTYWIEISRSAN